MLKNEQSEEELLDLADELEDDAEEIRENNREWIGDEKQIHQRTGQARGLEIAARRARERAKGGSE